MNKPCEYCGLDLPAGVDRMSRRTRSYHFERCEKRPSANVTFPCVVGHRIVELTDEQRAAAEWRGLSPEEKIARLLERVEVLESLIGARRGQA
jgi:hypothetical protein